MTNTYARHVGQRQGPGKQAIRGTKELVFFSGAAPPRVLTEPHLWAFYRCPNNADPRTFDGKLIGVSGP